MREVRTRVPRDRDVGRTTPRRGRARLRVYPSDYLGYTLDTLELMARTVLLNLNSSVDFSRRDAEAQRMLDICVVPSFRPKQDGFANLHLVGEKH